MDRNEGFPPHIIGFMRRKREKERLESEKPSPGPALMMTAAARLRTADHP